MAGFFAEFGMTIIKFFFLLIKFLMRGVLSLPGLIILSLIIIVIAMSSYISKHSNDDSDNEP